jgi:hypothetical protein
MPRLLVDFFGPNRAEFHEFLGFTEIRRFLDIPWISVSFEILRNFFIDVKLPQPPIRKQIYTTNQIHSIIYPT